MDFSKLLFSLAFLIQALVVLLPTTQAVAYNSNLFSAYIGAEFLNVTFSEVPINPHVDFHFILAFALDSTKTSPRRLTNGKFNIFWDDNSLSPSQVASIKRNNRNVKVALSVAGDIFNATSVKSWVSNAVSSLTQIIKEYQLDGIDIDYEVFHEDPKIFAECIGQLLMTLKRNGIISFVSIAPFAGPQVQKHYKALWKKYGHHIDYVNFQFYAYKNSTTISQFLRYYKIQSEIYKGGKVLVSYTTDLNGGLSPGHGFFKACEILKKQGKLHGIFVWSADDSKKFGFQYEKKAQALLADAH